MKTQLKSKSGRTKKKKKIFFVGALFLTLFDPFVIFSRFFPTKFLGPIFNDEQNSKLKLTVAIYIIFLFYILYSYSLSFFKFFFFFILFSTFSVCKLIPFAYPSSSASRHRPFLTASPVDNFLSSNLFYQF